MGRLSRRTGQRASSFARITSCERYGYGLAYEGSRHRDTQLSGAIIAKRYLELPRLRDEVRKAEASILVLRLPNPKKASPNLFPLLRQIRPDTERLRANLSAVLPTTLFVLVVARLYARS